MLKFGRSRYNRPREDVVEDRIFAKDAKIGKGVVLKSDIGTPDNPCEYVELGDHVYIGEGCNIQTPMFTAKDYTKIHRNALIYGRNPCNIGYNCWFGEGTVIDCEGYVFIGNNVGVGAHSQLWSHIRHGDVMMGCKYLNFGHLTIMDDVWLVGHCIASPVCLYPWSVALVGSVITTNMETNSVYGGSPAKNLTEKLGRPYAYPEVSARYKYMCHKALEFGKTIPEDYYDNPSLYGNINVVSSWFEDDNFSTQFNVTTRTYTKKSTPLEIAFMKFLLPEAKFIPV